MNIVQEIRRNIQTLDVGGSPALIDQSGVTTFSELFAQVDQLAAELSNLPAFATPHNRIGVYLNDSSHYVVTALAILQLGLCFVPIPPELTESEKEELVTTTALSAIVHSACSTWPQKPSQELTDELAFTSLPDIEPKFPQDKFRKLKPAFIRFSSGTTAKAKGVVISHQRLLERITAANEGLQISPKDRVLWILPMAHHFAVSIVLYLYHGATTLIETSRAPAAIARTALQNKATVLYASPFHYAQLTNLNSDSLPETLRLCVATAAPLPGEISKAFYEKFSLALTQGLGIIEVGLSILNRTPEKHSTALGSPLPAYRVKLKNGELLLKGPGFFDAYLTPWQASETVLQNGWFSTGDLVEELEPSVYTFVGRKKSVINVAGMKVFPEEVEAILNSHPAVEKSFVHPAEHPTLGQFPTAKFVLIANSPVPTPKDLRQHCQNKLSQHKIPLKFEQVTKLPLTPSGKLKRH